VRDYALYSSVTDIHAYLLALSLPPSPERDAVVACFVASIRESLLEAREGSHPDSVPPYVAHVLALIDAATPRKEMMS
jgi:hypothetical protein